MNRTLSFLIISAAASALATNAMAEPLARTTPGSVTVSVSVSYNDLNLTSDADVSKLARRVRFAAWKICAMPEGLAHSVRWRDEKRCAHDAFARAASDIRIVVARARAPSGLAANSDGGAILVARQSL